MTTLVYLGIGWLAGLAVANWLAPPPASLVLAALPALGGLVLYRASRPARRAGLCALAFLLGAGRMSGAAPHLDANHVAFYNDRSEVQLTGLIIADPDVRDNYVNLRLAAEQLTLDGQKLDVQGLVLIRTSRYPSYRYGDRLSLTAELETPPEFEDFSYKEYLARRGIHTMVRRPKIKVLATDQGSPFWTGLYVLRGRARQAVNRSLAEPYAALLSGILLGIESGIPQDLYDKFNATGTSHVIVISGSNVTLISGLLMVLGRKLLGFQWAAPLAIVGVILYTLLVGADPAVSRAALMGILWIIAMWVGRPGAALNALVASGLVMTAINPYTLWDVGFQLSFVATLGLILFVPSLEAWASGQLSRGLNETGVRLALNLLRETLLVTIAATLFTTPIIIYHFGRFSAISLVTNLLILPVQPFIMIFGGMAAIAGVIAPPLGQLLAWLVWLPLAWTVWIVETSAQIPLAAMDFGRMPWWMVVCSYVLLGLGLWWHSNAKSNSEIAYG